MAKCVNNLDQGANAVCRQLNNYEINSLLIGADNKYYWKQILNSIEPGSSRQCEKCASARKVKQKSCESVDKQLAKLFSLFRANKKTLLFLAKL